MKKNKIKDTGVEVTELSFGTSSLGSMPDTYGYEVPEQRAQETLKRFFQGPVICLILQEIMQWEKVKKELV
jgi:D-threo-aldose 1-dehydrogenase